MNKEQIKAEMQKIASQISMAEINGQPITKLQSQFKELSKKYKKFWLAENQIRRGVSSK